MGWDPAGTAATVSTTVAAVAVGAGLLAPRVVAAAAPALLATGFLAGLPHGAVDHLVPGWTGLTRRGPQAMAAVLAGYVATAMLAWLALTLTGPAAVLVLLAVSAAHFGLGDVADAPVRPRTRPVLVAAVVARGAPAVVLPLVLWPEITDPVLAGFDPSVPLLLGGGVREVLLAVLLTCAAVAVADALARRRPREAVETVLLLALFAVVPPLAAFGVYFGGWHALRHTARLVAADPRNAADLAAGRRRAPVLRFARSAAVPTLAVLVAVTVLVLLARQPTLLVPVLSVLLALTVPHVAVVAVLDRATLAGRPRSTAAPSGP